MLNLKQESGIWEGKERENAC